MAHDAQQFATVYQQAQRWIAADVFEKMVHDLRASVQLAKGKREQPTAAIFDGRTVQFCAALIRKTRRTLTFMNEVCHLLPRFSWAEFRFYTLDSTAKRSLHREGRQERAKPQIFFQDNLSGR